MKHLQKLIKRDKNGSIGRECPQPNCGKYFKVKVSAVPKGDDSLCHCPYCNHTDKHKMFYTKDQEKYIKSFVEKQSHDALDKYFDKAFSKGGFVKSGRKSKPRFYRYRERDMKTKIICNKCNFYYEVDGAPSFCPYCGAQI